MNNNLPDDWKDIITWDCIIDGISSCKDRTCGGKPPTLKSRIKGHGNGYWIFKRARNGGYPQILTDKLKPLFHLKQMGATRFFGNFSIKLIGKTDVGKISKYTVEKEENPLPYLVFPESKGIILNQKIDWKDDSRIMLDYLVIGMFRWGTVRATDFNGTNIILLNDNTLLSIDETEIENRKTIISGNDKKIIKSMINNKSSLLEICRKWLSDISKKSVLKVVLESGYESSKADWIMNNITNLEKNLIDQIDKLKISETKKKIIRDDEKKKNLKQDNIKNKLGKMNTDKKKMNTDKDKLKKISDNLEMLNINQEKNDKENVKYMLDILSKVNVTYKYRTGKTFHEFYVTTVKSALQKSIRRGNVNDAIAYAIELWLFVNDKENPSGGDGVVTNLINRLHIITSEDVGMGNPLLTNELQPLFQNLDKPKNYTGVHNKRKEPDALKNLLTIVRALCLSKHSRLISLLITPYLKLHYFKKLRKQFPKLYDTPDMKIKNHEEGFIAAITSKSPTAVYHCAYFYVDDCNFYKKIDLPLVSKLFVKKRKYEKIYWIWEQMLSETKELSIHNTIIELCKLYERKHAENKVYLVHAIALIILSPHIYDEPSIIKNHFYSIEKSLKILHDHVNNKMEDIPDIYKDMHTLEGMQIGLNKKSKKGVEAFIKDGMHIENAATYNWEKYGIYEKDLLECYIWSKLNLDLKNKKS